MTLDGKVTLPDGRWHTLSSREDWRRMQEIRSLHDLVIFGKHSVLYDNVRCPLRPPGLLLCRSFLPPTTSRFLRGRPLLFVHRSLKTRAEQLQNKACLFYLSSGDFAPRSILRRLSRMGFKRILFETGPAFNHALLDQRLIDRLYLTLTPFIIGKNDLPGIAAGRRALFHFEQREWKLVHHHQGSQEMFLEYKRI